MRRMLQPAFIVIVGALLATSAGAAEPRSIDWKALAGPTPAIAGTPIQISGYLLPVDQQGERVYEFMLVAAPGACSHGPQPPANQIIHVYPHTPYILSAIYEPVTITGALQVETEQTQFHMIDGVKVVETAYTIGRAGVAKAADMPAVPPSGNPMLRKH
jgi:hypothetical protein